MTVSVSPGRWYEKQISQEDKEVQQAELGRVLPGYEEVAIQCEVKVLLEFTV